MTRFILSVMIALLVLGGAIGGVVVAIAVHRHSGAATAAIAGAGTALGAWSSAALLGLAMEMADSLRAIAWALEQDD